MNRPRIAFLSAEDTRSRSAWSGTPFYMAQALERHVGDVVHLGPAFSGAEFAGKVRNRLSRALTGQPRPFHHAASLARNYARIFARRLRDAGHIDLIFAPAASTEIAWLETIIPIVYTSDTTFQLACNYHPGFTGLSDDYRDGGNDIERRALEKAAAIIYPSEWAARSARDFYGLPSERVRVVPYGANLDRVPSRETVLASKRGSACSILFLGVNWERKGGPVAFAAVAELRRRGIDATFTVCGCVPPGSFRAEWMCVIPRLEKSDPAQQARLSQLLLEATFLVLPTRNDCYGIVFCEAAAHGTPSIAPDTGGVSGAIADGVSGWLLPADAGGEKYADVIESVFRHPDQYRRLVESSRTHHDECVNWDRWGVEVTGIVMEAL